MQQTSPLYRVGSSTLKRAEAPLPGAATTENHHDFEFVISVVSNCRLLREGLAVLLNERLSVWLVGHYPATIARSVELPSPSGHIVLLDSGVGQDACLDWIRFWRWKGANVVVMEFGQDFDFLIGCIEAGACAYTVENASIDDIVEALHQVKQGAATCAPELAGKLFARLATYATNRRPVDVQAVSPLTSRELEVLHYVAQGYSNLDIASALVISVSTVKHHMHNILGKLDVAHRWDAVRYAEQQGWISLAH